MTNQLADSNSSTSIIAGLLSSTATTILINPLEVLKSKSHVTQPSFQTGRHTLNLGLKNGFLAGLSLNLAARVPFWTIFYPIRCQMKNNGYSEKVSSYTAGMAGAFVINPMYVIKTKIQTHEFSNRTSKSIIPIAKDIWSNEGIRGFYKGFGITFVSNWQIPCQFMMYNYFREYTSSTPLVILSAALAATLADTIFYPLQVIRTRVRHADHATNVFQETKKIIVADHHFRVWFRGLHWSLIKTIPSFTIMQLMYEGLIKRI